MTAITSYLSILLLGLFFNIILLFTDHQPLELCNAGTYIQENILFLTFALILHYLTCVTWERVTNVTNKKKLKITAKNGNTVIALVTLYVVITWSIIAGDNMYNTFFSDTPYCYLVKFEYLFTSPPHWYVVTVAIVTIWITICLTVVTQSTIFSIRFLRKHEAAMVKTFGTDQVRKVETKRFKVTYWLVFLFSFIWVPYGVSSVLRKYVSVEALSVFDICCRTIAYSSFMVLPSVYYLMDKRFEAHVTSLVKKHFKPQNEVGVR